MNTGTCRVPSSDGLKKTLAAWSYNALPIVEASFMWTLSLFQYDYNSSVRPRAAIQTDIIHLRSISSTDDKQRSLTFTVTYDPPQVQAPRPARQWSLLASSCTPRRIALKTSCAGGVRLL